MDEKNVSLTALDKMVNDERSQLAKAIIPYLPPQGQRLLSLYTKAAELANTAAVFSAPKNMEICAVPSREPLEILEDIRSYCFGKSRQKLDELTNLMTMVQMFRMIQEETQGEEEAYGPELEE